MDGWMDGWMDRWMESWKNGWMPSSQTTQVNIEDIFCFSEMTNRALLRDRW